MKVSVNYMQRSASIYELLGGESQIRQLVTAFYTNVQQDALLAPLFPKNIQPVMEKQMLFLTQLLGGPSLYSEQYGHPMMRARHLPFEITPERADAWLHCMRAALTEITVEPELTDYLMERFTGMAYHFINSK